MMIWKFIDRERKALCVVLAESEEQARLYAKAWAGEQGLPNADWIDNASVVVKNPAVPGVVGWST